MDLPKVRNISTDRLLKEKENPISLINLVPLEFKKILDALPEEFLNLTEEELDQKFPNPPATTQQLRKMFWIEYDRAADSRMKMDFSRVYVGTCTKEIFLKLLRTPSNLAWILCPPHDYTNQVEEMLTFALKQVREILALPLKNNLGFVDSKLADTKLRAAMMLDQRMKGMPVQRSMQVTHNIHESQRPDLPNSTEQNSIDDRIKQLELELEKVGKLPPPQMNLTVPQKNLVDKVVIEAEFTEVTPKEKGSSDGVVGP